MGLRRNYAWIADLEKGRSQSRLKQRRMSGLDRGSFSRRGAGAVEQASLENWCGGNSTVGSNPTLSAFHFRIRLFMTMTIDTLKEKGRRLRVHSLTATTAA